MADGSSIFTESLITIRETVKWVITAAAAVGAALVAGLQVTAVAQATPWWQLAALAAYAVAVVAVGRILHRASAVLLVSGITLSDLADRYVRALTKTPAADSKPTVASPDPAAADPLLAELSKRRGVLHPGDRLDILALYNEYKNLLGAQGRGETHDAARFDVVSNQAAQLTQAADLYMAQAEYSELRRTLTRAGGTVVVAVGFFAFAVGHKEVAEPAVTTPFPVSVVLTDDSAPAACPPILAGVAVGGTATNPQVVTQAAGPQCPPMRLHITDDVGAAIPEVSTRPAAGK